ncbi:uncharacterized protein B0H64DRAFT_435725 [Chaetomium fimeti]|uniref:Uncharacterized protein n=1 Tax=Chaetomium fimeti TaxID=1854472 RepID=A0AAE0H8Q9_9PEZI|nr:hypothetical protein B0H64DRAFT_435725 [Chaetomium fimeti]
MAIPTSTLSLSTTCLAVTRPASTYTAQYSSGEVAFLPTTTYTAPTTILHTYPATIEARCFTLGPGQTVPPGVSFVGASCSTDYYPGSTETTTYTQTPGQPRVAFGETLDVYTGTTTRYTTATYTIEPRTDISCRTIPDVHNPATCDSVTPLTWASLILTFIIVHLTWWLFDLPLLWKKRESDDNPQYQDQHQYQDPHQYQNQLDNRNNTTTNPKPDAAADANDRVGLAGFLFAIAWACLRSNAPGCAALYALVAGRGTGEYAALYYLGVRRERDGRAPEFTTWKLVTCVGADLLSLAVVGVTVYQACTLPEYSPRRWGVSLWAYPSLPTALIGLCLLVGKYCFPRTRRAAVGLVVMVVGVVVVVGAALALLLWRFDRPNDTWFMSVLFYGFMAFPAVLFGGPFVLLAIAYGCFGRIGGVTVAAWQHYAGGQPYCKMPGLGFAVVYLTLGLISALLALLAMALYHTDVGWRTWYKSLDPQASPTGISGLETRTWEPNEGSQNNVTYYFGSVTQRFATEAVEALVDERKLKWTIP